MIITSKTLTRIAIVGAAAVALAGCNRSAPQPDPSPAPGADASAEPTAAETEPTSIFRDEVAAERTEAPIEPLEMRIPFAQGGSDLSEAAKAELATVLASPQMKAGGAIILRGHTDSAGFDEANLRASKKRAEAVRDYLIVQGVAAERMTVIALGEMRPIAPNAQLDGSIDENGRAANRRVDVSIAVSNPAAEEKPATLIEAIAKPG